MMKRPFLRALILCMAALCLLIGCANDNTPDTTETTAPAETEPPVSVDRLSDKYDVDVNGIAFTPGTFTDRMTAEQLNEAVKMGQTMNADPLLYNLVKIMGLTRDNLTVYSEMNGDKLEAALIDGLFLEGRAMREALRGEYTIMAGDYPYTIYELASMKEEDLRALNIAEADLTAFCKTVIEIADGDGAVLEDHIYAFLGAHGALPAA